MKDNWIVLDPLSDFKATVKEEFTHEGFTFKKNEKYFVDQDKHNVYLLDNNENEHILSYDEAYKYIKSV